MFSENRSNNPPRAVPIYTLYPVYKFDCYLLLKWKLLCFPIKSEKRSCDRCRIAYTPKPRSYQGNVNTGVHQSHNQASPPKYEDVVNGSTDVSQPHRTYEVSEPAVIYVAPIKYTATQKALASVFGILFVVGFVSVFIKILSFS